MIKRIYRKFIHLSTSDLLSAMLRRALNHPLLFFAKYKSYFESKTGLEVGGPSDIFRQANIFPVYAAASTIDNCNFGDRTTWEGKINEGATFYFDRQKAPGHQYIAEATNLSDIASASYDFVLSSHCIEHVANPLLALKEWIRVLREEGLLLLVVPHKDGTFDHRRPVTLLEHLIQDYDRRTTEDDMTHIEEILKLHDLTKDPEAGDFENFKQRSLRNPENRCLHHHVFDTRLAVETVHHMGLQILSVRLFRPYHIFLVAQKLKPGQELKNDRFRGITTVPPWFKYSPFPSDRLLNC